MDRKVYTNREIMNFKVGTKVTLTDIENRPPLYKTPGRLVFQTHADKYKFGIEWDNCICFDFPAAEIIILESNNTQEGKLNDIKNIQ